MSDSQPGHVEDMRTDGIGIVRCQITLDPETSEYDLLEILADLDGCEIEELPSLYNEVEHVVETLFRTPRRIRPRCLSRFPMPAIVSLSTGPGPSR